MSLNHWVLMHDHVRTNSTQNKSIKKNIKNVQFGGLRVYKMEHTRDLVIGRNSVFKLA